MLERDRRAGWNGRRIKEKTSAASNKFLYTGRNDLKHADTLTRLSYA